jgi:hypothetical protein
VSRSQPPRLVGIVTRSDILSGYRRRLEEGTIEAPVLRVPKLDSQSDSRGKIADLKTGFDRRRIA